MVMNMIFNISSRDVKKIYISLLALPLVKYPCFASFDEISAIFTQNIQKSNITNTKCC